MIAVIETGGKQYLVKAGDIIKIEKIAGEAGKEAIFDKVLLLADEAGGDVKVGSPYIAGAKVTATILAQARAKKIRVVKYKRKIRYCKVHGHRQDYTKIKVQSL